jgi:hypothetical protein
MNRNFTKEILFFTQKIKDNIPFSIVRYGDGEMMIIENTPIDLTKKYHGEHKFIPNDTKYIEARKKMCDSIQFKSDNYFVGIPCPCCVGKERALNIYNYSKQNEKNITWANIFVNDNYKYFQKQFYPELKNKDVVVICHKNANLEYLRTELNIKKEFRVGVNAWIENQEILNEVIEYSKTVNPNTIFIFMAGTFTKICIYQIHSIRNDLFLLDLGSTLDLKIKLGETRQYLKNNSNNSNKICQWITS